ncbi:MAG: hypothetical protein ACXVB0_24490, partial [Mucilaginibacter sp.]
LYLVCLVVAPFPLGVSFNMSSHAMVYNRYGYALLALIMIDIFLFKDGYQDTEKMLKIGTSTGLAIAITLFLKVSYFGGAIILVGYSIFSKYLSKPYLLGLMLGFFIATIVLLSFIQFDIVALFNDLKMAAGARINAVHSEIILIKLIYNFPVFLFIILMGIQINNIESYSSEWSNYRILCFGFVVLFVDMLIINSNQQFFNLPLSVVFSLLLVDRTILSYQVSNKTSFFEPRCLRLVAPGFIFFFVFFGMDIAGLSYGVLQKVQAPKFNSAGKFIGSRLASLVLFDNETEPRANGALYSNFVNDGIYLIQNNSKSHETILTMEMFNPFSYSLGRQPAKGGIAAATFNYTISKQHHPSDDIFFGSADLVMVPKQPASASEFYDGFYDIYKSSIKQRFNLIAESNFWLLYRRK